MVAVEGGEHEIGAPADGFAYDNERPRHARRARRLPDRPHPGHQRRLCRVRRRHRRRAADVLGARRRGRLADDHVRRPTPARSRAPGRPRLLARGRRLRALGRQAAADRARVGGRGGRAPIASAPTSTSSRSAAPRPAPTPTRPRDCGAVQMLGDVWEWTASRLQRLSGLRGLPLPRVLGGLLRRRAQGAARRRLGDPPQRDPHQLSQLGPAAATPDLLRAALRQRTSYDGPSDSSAADDRPRQRRRPPAAGRPALGDGGGRPRRAHLPVQGALAALLLRRARLASCSSRSPSCPSTTRRAASARSSSRERPRSSPRPQPRSLIELGSGSAAKTRVLLDAMADAGCLETYCPGRHLRGDHPRHRRRGSRTSTTASRSAAWSATSSSTSRRCPSAGRG